MLTEMLLIWLAANFLPHSSTDFSHPIESEHRRE